MNCLPLPASIASQKQIRLAGDQGGFRLPAMDAEFRRLHSLFERLADADRATLLAFAEFLGSRSAVGAGQAGVDTPEPARTELPPPASIERPEQETIIAGLKRLARTYPMLDKSEMLGATSDIVATHLLQGSDPARVIDELEEIFRTHYQQLQASRR
jgi:hypothetical protein